MPIISSGVTYRFGLALSGGGYRAAAFHLGTLRKLEELGLLSKVDVLSTISGGSITGAAYALHSGSYAIFHDFMAAALQRCSVIGYVLRSKVFIRFALGLVGFLVLSGGLLFTRWAPLSVLPLGLGLWLILRFQFHLLPISREIEKAYNAYFFQDRTLGSLKEVPKLAIGSSNLETGRPFTFSRHWMGDSTYTYSEPAIRFVAETFPIARAVTASSCVPFAFDPVSITPPFFKNPEDYKRITPQLIDGGVYDNQGIQKLTQPKNRFACDLIVASDAGGGMDFAGNYRNTAALLLRTVDLFMNRIKNVQMAASLFQNVASRNTPIAYLSLSWELSKCIPGFVTNMAHGNVLPQVLAARQLLPAWIEHPKENRAAIEEHLRKQVNYATIAARDLTPDRLALASGVQTNLTPLTPHQFNALVQHAENLTELQIKLYLP